MSTRAPILAAATLAVALLAAPGWAQANSFMLAPGAPTAAELAHRIASQEAELRSRLSGQALRDFERERLAAQTQGVRDAAGPPQSEAHAYGRLQRRWQELDARLRLLRGTAPGANPP